MSRHGGTRAHASTRLARPAKPRRNLDADGLLVSAASQFLGRVALPEPAAPQESGAQLVAAVRLIYTNRPGGRRG